MVAPGKNRLFNILLADDGSPNVLPAIKLLTDLPIEGDCMVTALRVFTPVESSEYSTIAVEAEKTKKMLEGNRFTFQSELELGYPSEKIIEYATAHSPDLIVMGAKGSGMFAGMLGSVATNIVHSGHWPVLIARQPYRGLKKVMLVVDGSPASQLTSEFLGMFKLPRDASIEVLHVLVQAPTYYAVEPFGMAMIALSPEEETDIRLKQETQGAKLLIDIQKSLAEHGVKANTRLLHGDPATEIIKMAHDEQFDLIVCGSHGAGNLTGLLLGSVSRELVLNAPCSVLVVRAHSQI